MTRKVPSADVVVPELIWVGHGVWVARDPSLPESDDRRVIAYVEHKDHRVYVLWVRDRRDVCCYDTLREALGEVSDAWLHQRPSTVDAKDATPSVQMRQY